MHKFKGNNMKIFWTVFSLLVFIIQPAAAREQIRIVGSSTVYPFVSLAAEQFGMHDDYRTPIVESTGTGGGFKLFCSGIGERFPDINNASRQIVEAEVENCAENGIHNIVEIKLGYDGIVVATSKEAKQLKVTKGQLFLALAKEVPNEKGELVENFYTNWQQISADLPDQKIIMYGPPPTSGTRDAFVELVMEEGCKAFPAFETKYPDKKIRAKACHILREDGAFIEAGEDDNLVVQKLISNAGAIGIVGFAFYEENKHRIQASKINGVYPTMEKIASGEYAVSRSLFVYVKGEHFSIVHGLKQFAKELVNKGTIGMDGYLIYNGLIPLQEELRQEVEDRLENALGKGE